MGGRYAEHGKHFVDDLVDNTGLRQGHQRHTVGDAENVDIGDESGQPPRCSDMTHEPRGRADNVHRFQMCQRISSSRGVVVDHHFDVEEHRTVSSCRVGTNCRGFADCVAQVGRLDADAALDAAPSSPQHRMQTCSGLAGAIVCHFGSFSGRRHRKAGATSLMNSSRDLRFSSCGRLLSHQKLNSSTPSAWY
jgi:hypothetical protein